MIPVGEPYRPTGQVDAQSVLITLILGATTALVGAGLIWLWEISPIPTLIILTPIIQGCIVGAALTFMVGRLRMRNPWLVGTIGFACGLLSIVLVHFGHHLRFVSQVAGSIRADIAAAPETELSAEKKRELLAQLDADPSGFVGPLLREKTGHGGFLGTMMLRNEGGVTIKRSKVTGGFLWALWGAEALIVAYMAATMASSRASEPFCEDCGFWCAKEPDLFALPGAQGGPLTEAIRTEDAVKVDELRARPPADDGTGVVGVTLHACPQCDQAFVDVSQRVQKGKETKTTTLLKELRVSPALAHALRQPPAPPEPVEGPEPEGEGPPESSDGL